VECSQIICENVKKGKKMVGRLKYKTRNTAITTNSQDYFLATGGPPGFVEHKHRRSPVLSAVEAAGAETGGEGGGWRDIGGDPAERNLLKGSKRCREW
jgi:hypothetical protein